MKIKNVGRISKNITKLKMLSNWDMPNIDTTIVSKGKCWKMDKPLMPVSSTKWND